MMTVLFDSKLRVILIDCLFGLLQHYGNEPFAKYFNPMENLIIFIDSLDKTPLPA
jgi:hypothetical protein